MKQILLFIIFGSHLFLNAQDTYTREYDLDPEGIINSMIDMEITENNIYVLSNHFSENAGVFSSTIHITKFDLAGNIINTIVNDSLAIILSVSLMGQSSDDCITVLDDDIYISINHNNDGYENTYVYKYDLNLNFLDLLTYPVSVDDALIINEGNTIIDNNIFIYGNIVHEAEIPDSVQVIRSDLNGNIIWTKHFSIGDNTMNVNSVQSTPDGNLALIFCHAPASGAGGLDPTQIIAKINMGGEILSTYNSEYELEQQNRVLVADDGSYYYVSDNHPITGFDGMSYGRINKVNANMTDFEWSLRIPNHAILDGRHYRTEDIIQTQNGDFITCGTTRETTDSEIPGGDLHTTWNGFMIRTTSEGEIVWLRIYRNENDIVLPAEDFGRFRPSYFRKVRELPDGRIVAAGDIELTGLQFNEIDFFEDERSHLWLLVVGEDGCLEDYPCQELILMDDPMQVTPPTFTVGTKWTYEYFPEPENPNEIIHSYITYELTDTIDVGGTTEYIIENNRDFPIVKMRQNENEVWIYNETDDIWQLTYDFNAVYSYESLWEDDVITVNVDTLIDFGLWLEDRGVQPIQNISVTENLDDTLTTKEILKTIGAMSGGLTFYNHPEIKKIRCFDQGDYHHNFGPLFYFTIACDSIWVDVIGNTNDIAPSMQINVSPNPSNGSVRIQGLEKDVYYELYHTDGSLIDKGFTEERRITLSRTGLQILRMNVGDQMLSFKVVNLE